MNNYIEQIAERIRTLRQILEFTVAEMAETTGMTEQEYMEYESGTKDFSFNFLFKCSTKFGVDISELVIGETPKLKLYTLTRKGQGMPIKRREGFKYRHLAHLFKNRIAEPFIVTAKYKPEEENQPIAMSTHKGQELEIVLKGKMKFEIKGHTEILEAGDSIYFDSSNPHGMIAWKGDCEFLAVVMRDLD